MYPYKIYPTQNISGNKMYLTQKISGNKIYPVKKCVQIGNFFDYQKKILKTNF